MGFKKYVNDYEKQYIIKPNGKPGLTAVYRGKYFRFVSNGTTLRLAKIRICALTAFAFLLSVGSLFIRTVGARTLYVALPHVIGLFPMVHLLLGAFNLLTCTPPLKRESNDKITERITNSSVAAMIIFGITYILEFILCILSNFPVPDLIYSVIILLITGFCALIFYNRRYIRTEECGSRGEDI